MLAVAGLYLAFAVAYWLQGRKSFVTAPVLALIVLAGVGLGQLPGYAAPCRVERDYYCIRVVDLTPQSGGPSAAMVHDHLPHSLNDRSEGRRVGNGCGRTCRSRGRLYH